MGYSLLTGINYDTLMDWGADERKLSTKGFDIVLVPERIESS